MWFLQTITIMYLVQFIMIQRTYTKPHTFLNSHGNNRRIKNYFLSGNQATEVKNTNSEPIFKAFNFHDIEYPMAASPRRFYSQDFNDKKSLQYHFTPDASNLKITSDLKSAMNRTLGNLQKIAKPISNKHRILPDSSMACKFDSGLRKVGNFPEVEYPLTAQEIWKPNYWSILSDDNELNLKSYQNFAKNVGICSKSGKYGSFPVKSCSNTARNKDLLKQIKEYKTNESKKQNNSTCRKNLIANGEKKVATCEIKVIPTEKTVEELQTTALPYCFTPMDITPDCYNINIYNNKNLNKTFSPILIPNDFTPKRIKTDNIFTDNASLEANSAVMEHKNKEDKDMASKSIDEIKYDPNDIIDIRKPENDLCGLDEDYTTDIYPEVKNIGWFSQPVSTPAPCSTTEDMMWKNCKIISPCELPVDELEDNYIYV